MLKEQRRGLIPKPQRRRPPRGALPRTERGFQRCVRFHRTVRARRARGAGGRARSTLQLLPRSASTNQEPRTQIRAAAFKIRESPVGAFSDALAFRAFATAWTNTWTRAGDLLLRAAMAVDELLEEQPKVWLSTSGLGVYWLHVRLDSRPKYYQFKEFAVM